METHKYILLKLTSIQGSLKHYFHFLYSVLIPLILEYISLSQKYKNLTFIIDTDLGPMLRILLQLPIDIKLKCYLTNFNELNPETVYLKSMDLRPTHDEKDLKFIEKGWAKRLTKEDYIKVNKFMKDCISNHNLFSCREKYDIVIIERKTSVGFSTTEFVKNKYTQIMKTSGSERRSIINHSEFVNCVKKIFVDSNILNVSLEYLPLFDQYNIFNNAKIIIAQHGAALGNIIFMKQNSIVIEIISKVKIEDEENWFEPISKECGIKHYQFVAEKEHAKININKFKNFIKDILK